MQRRGKNLVIEADPVGATDVCSPYPGATPRTSSPDGSSCKWLKIGAGARTCSEHLLRLGRVVQRIEGVATGEEKRGDCNASLSGPLRMGLTSGRDSDVPPRTRKALEDRNLKGRTRFGSGGRI